MAIASINPATGETLREFNALAEAQIEEKLGLAESTFRKHRVTSLAARASILSAAAELLEQEVDALVRIITLEMGKPIAAARDEVRKCAGGCQYYAENGERCDRHGGRKN